VGRLHRYLSNNSLSVMVSKGLLLSLYTLDLGIIAFLSLLFGGFSPMLYASPTEKELRKYKRDSGESLVRFLIQFLCHRQYLQCFYFVVFSAPMILTTTDFDYAPLMVLQMQILKLPGGHLREPNGPPWPQTVEKAVFARWVRMACFFS
jgi:hypothetical protein